MKDSGSHLAPKPISTLDARYSMLDTTSDRIILTSSLDLEFHPPQFESRKTRPPMRIGVFKRNDYKSVKTSHTVPRKTYIPSLLKHNNKLRISFLSIIRLESRGEQKGNKDLL